MEARLWSIYRSVASAMSTSGGTQTCGQPSLLPPSPAHRPHPTRSSDAWRCVFTSSPLRVCVVGGGSISREFALHHFGDATSTVVSSVVDLDEGRALQLATDVGSVQAGAVVRDDGTAYRAAASETRGTPVPHATSLGGVVDGCDIVYIGTTPGAHAPLVLEALDAGKHVLIEKPLAASPADADAIVQAAEAAAGRGQWLGMDIGMRWNPALHELRRLAVEERALGALRSARLKMHYTMWPREWQVQPWCAGRAEGGPLREVGTHFFFGIMEAFGHGCVKRVRADITYADGEGGTQAETAASGEIELESGLVIELDVRTDSAVGDVYELVRLTPPSVLRTTTKQRPGAASVAELTLFPVRQEVAGEEGSLMLVNFSQLKRTAPTDEWLVEEGSYGRVESVTTLVDAVRVRTGTLSRHDPSRLSDSVALAGHRAWRAMGPG